MTPRRQPRGEERRRQVLEAAIRVLAREGPRGVTHRAVAKEAATSVRATTYYFASREELLAEALRHYAAGALARFDGLALPLEALAGAPAELAAGLLADAVLGDVVGDRDGLVAEFELVLECSRGPALREDYARWQEGLEGLLARYTAGLGSEDPGLDARLVLATLRGLELEALAQGGAPDRAYLVRVFRRLLDALLA